jgi:hypothetical protein
MLDYMVLLNGASENLKAYFQSHISENQKVASELFRIESDHEAFDYGVQIIAAIVSMRPSSKIT